MKSARNNIEVLCFNTDKEEAKSVSISKISHSSSEKYTKSFFQEVHASNIKLTFTYYDLLLVETLHNCPLYMIGHALEKMINRILIDKRYEVNILPNCTMKELGITTKELSESRLIIQEFNQGGKMTIFSIKLEIQIEDL